MTYEVLARKWRPRSFSEIVGQEHVLRALINALDHDRLHHAFIFTGTRGVGKTTIARILAKAVNCEKGVTSTPCGNCSACREIDTGRFVDLIEVDAASRTKVDDTRELLENVQYAPQSGRFKVYLIDEVHMLSNHSFNALLKTLEEPPPHVKFLLATTDPQKLPVTVLSRCLQFNLKRLSPAMIGKHLLRVVEAEGVPAERAAIDLVARAADGSVRDALSILDQAIAYGGGRLNEADVRALLGTMDTGQAEGILEALAGGDGHRLMQIVAELEERGADYEAVLDEVAGTLQKIAVQQVLGEPVQTDAPELRPDSGLAGLFTAEDIQLLYQIALIGKRDLYLAPDPRSGLEMSLLRMLAFQPVRQNTVADKGEIDQPVRTPSPQSKARSSPQRRQAGPKTAVPGPRPSPEADWAGVIDGLSLKGMAKQLAVNCAFKDRDGTTLRFLLDSRHRQLITEQSVARVEEALSQYLGEPVRIRIDVGDEAMNTPARRDQENQAKRLAGARESLEQEPNLKALKDAFGAEVRPESVKPID